MVGTTKIVSKVPKLIPPTITQPICLRLSAPAPEAIAKGIAPNTIAPVVIVFVLLQRSFTRGILAGSIKE